MAAGRALVVGLKSVNPASYGGWTGENGCWGCELDADNVSSLLREQGFDVTVLKTQAATGDAILSGIKSIAGKMAADDIFVFYYSGHGGQQPDTNGDERDGEDETLVAYDREVVDDELNQLWTSLPTGLRVVMMSDSCNSGTNYRMIGTVTTQTVFLPLVDEKTVKKMKAQMIHFGGCRDGFSASGYHGGGVFTMALCDIWAGGSFQGNYKQLLDQIRSRVKTGQVPQYNEYGPVSADFRLQKPFTVDARRCVTVNVDVRGDTQEAVLEALRVHLGENLADAVAQCSGNRGCSVSASGSASSGGDWSVSGTITCTL